MNTCIIVLNGSVGSLISFSEDILMPPFCHSTRCIKAEKALTPLITKLHFWTAIMEKKFPPLN